MTQNPNPDGQTSTPTTKPCATCKEILPLESFSPSPRMALGRHSYCKPCNAAWRRKDYLANIEVHKARNRASSRRNYDLERHRGWYLKSKYGITRDQYDAMLESQGSGCAICGANAPGGKGDWHVDHEHNAKKRVRGLLCAGCNVGIGHLGDDPERLVLAAQYLLSFTSVLETAS